MEDKLYLRSIMPFRGVFQTTINILLHDLIAELRARNITTYSPDNTDIYIECLRRRTNTRAAGHTVIGDECGSAKGVHNPDAVVASKPAGIVKRADGGPRKTGGKNKGK